MAYIRKNFYSALADNNEDSMIACIEKCRSLGHDPEEFLTALMEWRYDRCVRSFTRRGA